MRMEKIDTDYRTNQETIPHFLLDERKKFRISFLKRCPDTVTKTLSIKQSMNFRVLYLKLAVSAQFHARKV